MLFLIQNVWHRIHEIYWDCGIIIKTLHHSEKVSIGTLERSWNTLLSRRERLISISQTTGQEWTCGWGHIPQDWPLLTFRQGKSLPPHSLKTNQFKKSHCSASHIVPNGCCPGSFIKSSLNELHVVTTAPKVQDDPTHWNNKFLLLFASILAQHGSLRGSPIS